MSISSAGSTNKTLAEVREEIKSVYTNQFGANIAIEKKGGGVNSLFEIDVRREYLLEQNQTYAYSQLSISTAESENLDNLCLLNNVERKFAKKSVGTVTFIGIPGTTIPEGFQISNPFTGLIYQTLEEVIFISTSIDASIEALEGGINGNTESGTITNIVNPLTGVNSVNNALQTTGGTDIETDGELRARYLENTTNNIGTYSNLKNALEAIENVNKVYFKENLTLSQQGEVPPLSVEFIVEGGKESEIADVFLNHFAIPVRTFGTETITVQNVFGRDVEFQFSRPESVSIDVQLTITLVAGKSLSAEFESAIKNQVSLYVESISLGASVSGSEIVAGLDEGFIEGHRDDFDKIVSVVGKLKRTENAIYLNKITFNFNEFPLVNEVEIV